MASEFTYPVPSTYHPAFRIRIQLNPDPDLAKNLNPDPEDLESGSKLFLNIIYIKIKKYFIQVTQVSIQHFFTYIKPLDPDGTL